MNEMEQLRNEAEQLKNAIRVSSTGQTGDDFSSRRTDGRTDGGSGSIVREGGDDQAPDDSLTRLGRQTRQRSRALPVHGGLQRCFAAERPLWCTWAAM